MIMSTGDGIRHDSALSIDDFSQDMELHIIVKHADKDTFDEETHPNFFRVVDKDSRNENNDLTRKRKLENGTTAMDKDQHHENAKRLKIDLVVEKNGDLGDDDTDIITL